METCAYELERVRDNPMQLEFLLESTNPEITSRKIAPAFMIVTGVSATNNTIRLSTLNVCLMRDAL